MRTLNSTTKTPPSPANPVRPPRARRGAFRFWLFCLLVLSFVTLTKDWFVKFALETVVREVTGTRVEITDAKLRLFKPSITARGVRVYQPEGYPPGLMAEAPMVVLDYDFMAALDHKVHIPLLVVSLQECILIRDEEGRLNVDALAFVRRGKENPSEPMPMQIDLLNLSIDRVVYQNFRKNGPPVINVYEVGMRNRKFRNINSGLELAALITLQAMAPTAVRSAATYALTSLLGLGSYPIGVVGMFLGKDSGVAEYPHSFESVYTAAQAALQDLGAITVDAPQRGVLKAKVQGCWVAVKIEPADDGKMRVVVSARKFFLPKPAVALGILHQMSSMLQL